MFPVGVPVQVPVKPVGKVTAGVVGMPNPASNVTVIVLPVASAPVAEGVKPTAQIDVAWAAGDPGANVTPVGAVAADANSWPMNGAAIPAMTTAGRRSVRARRTNGTLFELVSRPMLSPLLLPRFTQESASHQLQTVPAH